MSRLWKIVFLVVWCVAPFGAHAQMSVADSLVAIGDSLRKSYCFEESLNAYNNALEQITDTVPTLEDSLFASMVNEKLLLSENGKNMCSFVYEPVVIAKQKFSIEDFFLYYPIKDRSWRSVPNQLDTVSGKYAKAIYAPDDEDVIYFSSVDKEGIRNIYTTRLADTLWTYPSLLNEQMTSVSDEIYPMLSPDGKRLFFASDGLYGVGGYDLYVSQWDEETADWSVPVNMGFPYSSPANDFLFVNSSDDKYTLFASDRDCQGDSVWVYVLEYDDTPVRNPVSDPEKLLLLSLLEPSSGVELRGGGDVKSDILENEQTRNYMSKMAQVRALRDSIALCETSLADHRERYSHVEDEQERQKIGAEILGEEAMIPVFQKKLDDATRELQQIEMNFLFSGVVIDPAHLLDEAEREVVAETASYTFSKMLMGEPLHLEIEIPLPEYDYSFKVLDTAQVIKDFLIPEGIVYQIQVTTSSRPVSLKSLKGMAPVFETTSSSGRYIYRAGLFSTYKEVISNLNTVKKLGFKNAYVVGYVDGKEMQVGKVRNIENERKKTVKEYFQVLIYPAGGNLDPVAMAGIRQQAGEKDIARNEDGYFVGPFENKGDATALIEFIEVMGYGDAKLEKIQ